MFALGYLGFLRNHSGLQAPLLLRDEWQEDFVDQVEELGMAMAAGLDAGVL
ncbi:hypothetical protein [Halomonas sp. CKK8]|uniref:hypothetical protein n=1 Tax=Halomonas sp. CKK8 TaxID=3036127 RepID=UPI002415804B|nr:hypothetical protein [Halomonas sp. CKK8]WFM72423.1 hypothetical protein P8934_05330 [Halomonas sp. CKK8]